MFRNKEEIYSKVEQILQSPKQKGELRMIAARPSEDKRIVMETGNLLLAEGLEGDSWKKRWSRHTADNSPHLENQLTLMNSRVIDAITDPDKWALAGDQLYVDFDLSEDNVPAGTKIQIGEALIEVSALPHNGCGKFKGRFGVEALKFVNSADGKKYHFRGVNAKVIKEGKIKTGDPVTKL